MNRIYVVVLKLPVGQDYLYKKIQFIPNLPVEKMSRAITLKFMKKLKKYRFYDSPKFIWAIYGPYKKRESLKKHQSKYHLKSMVETLIAIYNADRLTKIKPYRNL